MKRIVLALVVFFVFFFSLPGFSQYDSTKETKIPNPKKKGFLVSILSSSGQPEGHLIISRDQGKSYAQISFREQCYNYDKPAVSVKNPDWSGDGRYLLYEMVCQYYDLINYKHPSPKYARHAILDIDEMKLYHFHVTSAKWDSKKKNVLSIITYPNRANGYKEIPLQIKIEDFINPPSYYNCQGCPYLKKELINFPFYQEMGETISGVLEDGSDRESGIAKIRKVLNGVLPEDQINIFTDFVEGLGWPGGLGPFIEYRAIPMVMAEGDSQFRSGGEYEIAREVVGGLRTCLAFYNVHRRDKLGDYLVLLKGEDGSRCEDRVLTKVEIVQYK